MTGSTDEALDNGLFGFTKLYSVNTTLLFWVKTDGCFLSNGTQFNRDIAELPSISCLLKGSKGKPQMNASLNHSKKRTVTYVIVSQRDILKVNISSLTCLMRFFPSVCVHNIYTSHIFWWCSTSLPLSSAVRLSDLFRIKNSSWPLNKRINSTFAGSLLYIKNQNVFHRYDYFPSFDRCGNEFHEEGNVLRARFGHNFYGNCSHFRWSVTKQVFLEKTKCH